MGKVTYRGLRKPGDPVLGQTVIVIGGLRGKKRSKQASKEKSPSQKAEEPGPKKEE